MTGRVQRVRTRIAATRTTRFVLVCVVAAVLLHFPGLLWPLRPDEAGFTLVGRHWDPEPESLYGPYWVDRPPPLILIYRLSDLVGGPYFLRIVAAVGCAALVAMAARCGYLLGGSRAARWAAVTATALTSTTLIDPVSAKGEVLGIPFVMASIWLALEALRVLERSRWSATALAFVAGMLGAMAMGLKQNMVTGLAFGGFLLLTSAIRREITWPSFGRLASAALVGAAIPFAVVIGWCLAVGVELDVLWYSVYGFRADAIGVISDQVLGRSKWRALILGLYFLLTGMALIAAWLAINARSAWRRHPSVTVATLAIIFIDLTSLILGGSFWRPYLHLLTPGVVLATALLAGSAGRTLVWTRRLTAYAVASAAVALVVWCTQNQFAGTSPEAELTGEAIGASSRPGDTIVIHGGRADLVMASGLESPYTYLWSLPMRTLDPDRAEMVALLRSGDRPTWFVEWVDRDHWSTEGLHDFNAALEIFYEQRGVGCHDEPIYLRRDVERPALELECGTNWRYWSRR